MVIVKIRTMKDLPEQVRTAQFEIFEQIIGRRMAGESFKIFDKMILIVVAAGKMHFVPGGGGYVLQLLFHSLKANY